MKRGKKACPFWLETTWVDQSTGQPKVINDCAPKRSVMLSIDGFNRMQGLQQAAEQERNMQHRVLQTVAEVANANIPLPQLTFETVEDAEVLQIPEETDED
jgi:hypothetical protein